MDNIKGDVNQQNRPAHKHMKRREQNLIELSDKFCPSYLQLSTLLAVKHMAWIKKVDFKAAFGAQEDKNLEPTSQHSACPSDIFTYSTSVPTVPSCQA